MKRHTGQQLNFEASQPADRDGKAPSAATRYAVAKYVLKEGGGLPQQGKRRRRNIESQSPDWKWLRRVRKRPSGNGARSPTIEKTCCFNGIQTEGNSPVLERVKVNLIFTGRHKRPDP